MGGGQVAGEEKSEKIHKNIQKYIILIKISCW